MRAFAIAALISAAAVASVQAQPRDSAPIPLGAPRAFAGYTQPDITPGLCRNLNANVSQCTIPAGTAGRYLIRAAGTSSSPRQGARQQLSILLGNETSARSCATATNNNAWPSGARTFRLECAVTVVTDRPITVFVRYADENATVDRAGPTIAMTRLPWDGILDMQYNVPTQ